MELAGDETTAVDHTIPDQPSSPTRTAYPPTRGPSHRRSTRNATSSGSRFEHIRRQTTLMLTPQKKLAPPPTFLKSLKAILIASWLNLLLVCIPVSWALHWALPDSNKNKDTLVFIFSFFSIIPLAKLLAFATDELSIRVGQTLAGLLNATLGNAVELIVAIIALVKCELRIVQASLVGSVLSNLLLVLGMCFFAGGLKYSEQGFGISATQLNSSLLTISVIGVLLPAAFHFAADPQLDNPTEAADILSVSHGVAIILLFIYLGYLYFQLYSHTELYSDDNAIQSTKYVKKAKEDRDVVETFVANTKAAATGFFKEKTKEGMTFGGRATATSPRSIARSFSDIEEAQETNIEEAQGTNLEETPAEDEEIAEPQMTAWMTILLLAAVTVLVAITAEWLVDSINGLTETHGISKEFVGMILLPIVGNAAEHLTAVTVSVKDKLTLSLGVAVGSSIQIALFVIPFIVTLGWIIGKPMTLLFDPYESVAMFLAVLTVNYVVQDGKSNWLEGFILMGLYVILAVTFWYYPGSDPFGVLATCH